MIRCVFLINLIVVFSAFSEMTMKNECDKYSIYFSNGLTVRCLLKSIPYIVTGILLIGFLFVFSYTLQKFEIPYMLKTGQNWSYLINGFWNTIITMSTVGYGDLFASTNFGRFTAVVIMFWGAFINSLILVAMQISAAFTPQEQAAYEDYTYMMTYKEMVESAGTFIQSFLYVRCLNRKALVVKKYVPKKSKQPKRVDTEEKGEPGTPVKPEEDVTSQSTPLNTEQREEKDKADAMEHQAYFNALSIKQKRGWFGNLRKCFVDFKIRRKMFAVDHSKLEIDKEIDFLTNRLENFILKCKAYAGNIDDIHILTDKIANEQEKALTKLELLTRHIDEFDRTLMVAKREKQNDALNKAAEETMERDDFENVSEGSR